MNKIIPNELSFNFDLNDLPARATQVSKEELGLSGRGCRDYHDARPQFGLVSDFSQNQARTVCPAVCRSAKRRWNGHFRPYVPGGNKISCGCCT